MTTCRRLAVPVACMGADVVRRKRKDPGAALGVPAELTTFVPANWPGKSEYQRWAAWSEARYSWADANLPNGYEDMPEWDGVMPDQPWDEVKHTI